jgi:diguanylate cyclase (GGDEF)-like protein
MAYEPTGIKGAGDLFATWAMTISNNAGSFYMNSDLQHIADELRNLYLRDPLTGLYNRRGLNRLSCLVAEKSRDAGNFLTVICADVDNLKQINDKYGHEAGDIAITKTAEAIETCLPKGSICTRTGGDEYCVLFSHDSSDNVDRYISDIETYLNRYNSVSGLPYNVGCSCGYYSISPDEPFVMGVMIKQADMNMYKVKYRKKAAQA